MSSAERQSELPQFLQLVRFENVDGADVVNHHARTIHDDYMERYGGGGAFTIDFLALDGPWDYAIRYAGPEDSAEWLGDRIEGAAREVGEAGGAEVLTLRVTKDLTERY